MSKKMIEQGIKTTYKAQGNLVNDYIPGRFAARQPWAERYARRDRMNARLTARREQLFGARRQMERNATAQQLRALRKTNPAVARQVATMRRMARTSK